MEIIDREAAHKAGRRQFYTGKACKRGHLGPRFVSNGNCVACATFKIIPAMQAPNTGLPPTPYIFPVDTQVSPELISYVHSRVLSVMVRRATLEYARLRPTLKISEHQDAASVANAVLHAFHAEQEARRAALRAQGWTDAQLDAVQLL